MKGKKSIELESMGMGNKISDRERKEDTMKENIKEGIE